MDAAAYLDQLQQLLPNGPAWSRDPDAELTRLLAAIAEEFARVDARTGQLFDEADPRTALELLPDWERVVGLPDPCTGAIASTVPERRLAIVGALTARGGQSIVYLTQLAASLGYAIAIEEFRLSRAGAMRAGDACHGIDDWAFTFEVDVLPPGAVPGGVDPITGITAFTAIDVGVVFLRAGTGRSGDRLQTFGSSAIECVIRRARPAHTSTIFAYPPDPPAAFFFDFTQAA